MTNGEKMQEMFPEGKIRRCRGGVVFESDGWCHAYDSDWWNTEHKEPTNKNDSSGLDKNSKKLEKDFGESDRRMTRERIEEFRKVLLPFVKKWLLRINYENRGKSDADEFEKDFNEICDLAMKALEQEPKPMVEIDLYSVIKQKYIEREVLDKVSSEIEELYSYVEFDEDIKTSFNMVRLEEVQRVIDKYKAESEDKE